MWYRLQVSIHAPRVGRDGFNAARTLALNLVSIHAPRVGRDRQMLAAIMYVMFQFTRPAWGATPSMFPSIANATFQFTRPAWGATDRSQRAILDGDVSIHAPRVGRDKIGFGLEWIDIYVSIHAPRVGRDGGIVIKKEGIDCFNSRAPRGARRPNATMRHRPNVSIHAPRVGRDYLESVVTNSSWFQFTRPAWGATYAAGTRILKRISFNSRAPRGARHPPINTSSASICFNSRAPRGARQKSHTGWRDFLVSIHAPRVGRDRDHPGSVRGITSFNSRAPRGARLKPGDNGRQCMVFQFTRPAWGATHQPLCDLCV